MPHRLRRVDRVLRFAPMAATGMVLVLMWAIVLWFTAIQQHRLLQESEKSLDLVNRALAQQTVGLLDDASVGLKAIEQWVNDHPQATPSHDRRLAMLASTLSGSHQHLLTLRVLDDRGHPAAWGDEPPDGRFTFGQPVPLPEQGQTLIAEPRQSLRGEWVLPVVRRVGHQGAAAFIDLDRLKLLHASLLPGSAGSIALVRSDGVVLSRVPVFPGFEGSNITDRWPQARALLALDEGTQVTGTATLDGIRRISAFRKVRGHPVTLSVTQGYDEALSTYFERRRLVIGSCLAITAAALLALWMFSKAQRLARLRQAELAAVSDESPLGMFRTDREGALVYVNDAYLRIHGLERSQARRGWLGLMPEAVRQKAQAEWSAIVQARSPWRAVRRLRSADGRDLLVAVDTAPVIVDGVVMGHVGTVKDITDQARGERALRTLSAVFDATSDFVIQADARGRLQYLNPSARRTFGIAADADIARMTYEQLNPARMVERYQREILPLALEHGIWSGETTKIDAQGRELTCSHVLIVHRDKTGRVDHFSAILRDITQEKAATRSLARSAAMLRAVADAMPALVAVVDKDERYIFANAAFERWQGASAEGVIGRSMREVLGELEYQRSLAWARRALGGEPVVFEKDYSDGARSGWRHLQIRFTPLQLADGTVDGFIGIAEDVTGHREEEARLREMARVDPLTGALNRAGLEYAFEHRARRGDGELRALVYVDLDRFKGVNDEHGHAVGDQLLVEFCRRVREVMRPGDALARLGGDEFAVILDALRDEASARTVAGKILAVALAPFDIGPLQVRVGASLGIALWRGQCGDLAALMARADGMLYSAKQSGRACYRVDAGLVC
ncbi:PAS domain S-box protein [Piscinibacter terrae]|uniref:PAS domain S-box protein n=1 Tax=Piscinibacter terrae TaxID=2496871 RepID=A0A3N7HT28_9BURK|nr:PAS domain S-box protein [Albitalea terrae]RQP24923.1 PAS domain S-box protein [Albitalea terrae]